MAAEKEITLIQKARQVFMQYGIKSVNMDDMAHHLGISKKTLYQYVNDKEDLVNRVVTGHCRLEDEQIREICKRGLNAIDEQFEIMQWVMDILKTVHPSIIFDLQKYHPEVFASMNEHRQRLIFDCLMHNMKKGQREGLYRKDFMAEAIAKFYISRIELIFDQKVFPNKAWSLPQIYMELFKYHIRGIASGKGIEYLKQKTKHLK